MRILTVLMAVIAVVFPGFADDVGSVCVAPISWKPLPYSAPGLYCDSNKVSLKVDSQVIASPIKISVRVDQLDLSTRHRVVILCDGKPQQSFTFRFSDFPSSELCLFLNDLYKTAQLAEAK